MKSQDSSKVYVLDTNILLHEPFAFMSFQEHDVIVPMTVLEELDHIKDRKKDVSRDARIAIRAMEDLLKDATPEEIEEGVPLPENNDGSPSGKFSIFPDHNIELTPKMFPTDENDHKIINAALYLQSSISDRLVVLVTKDINMRLKAKGAGMEQVEDYRTDQLIDDIRFLTKGYYEFDGSFWEKVKNCDSRTEGRDTWHSFDKSLIPTPFINEYLIDEGKEFAAKISEMDEDSVTVKDLGYERIMGRRAWGIQPRNIQQAMALQALLDPEMDLVVLTGPAGCGKTGITASFFSIFVQTYLQTLFLLKKLSINNKQRANISNMSLSVT